jgi:hypothetical protein
MLVIPVISATLVIKHVSIRSRSTSDPSASGHKLSCDLLEWCFYYYLCSLWMPAGAEINTMFSLFPIALPIPPTTPYGVRPYWWPLVAYVAVPSLPIETHFQMFFFFFHQKVRCDCSVLCACLCAPPHLFSIDPTAERRGAPGGERRALWAPALLAPGQTTKPLMKLGPRWKEIRRVDNEMRGDEGKGKERKETILWPDGLPTKVWLSHATPRKCVSVVVQSHSINHRHGDRRRKILVRSRASTPCHDNVQLPELRGGSCIVVVRSVGLTICLSFLSIIFFRNTN